MNLNMNKYKITQTKLARPAVLEHLRSYNHCIYFCFILQQFFYLITLSRRSVSSHTINNVHPSELVTMRLQISSIFREYEYV